MSLKKNIAANYISQIYVAGIGILILPLYIKYMGAEAYGLIAFYAMLQAVFSVLDAGLAATNTREMARFRGGLLTPTEYIQLFKALNYLFIITAIIGVTILLIFSFKYGNSWLNIEQLGEGEVQYSLAMMSFIVGLRWYGGLFRGVISGCEKFVWLSTFNVIIVTLKFVLIVPILIFVDSSPIFYFTYQTCVVVIEVLGLLLYSRSLMPKQSSVGKIILSFSPLRSRLKFAASVAFTSTIWVLVTQADKLVLSSVLPLSEYGYFTLAVLLASVIMLLITPVKAALLPRFSKLEAEKNDGGILHLYGKITQLISSLTISVAYIFAMYSESILWAWTGDRIIAVQASTTLSLYVIGYYILSISAFPFYLQFAKGDLKLHVVGNVVLGVVLIPVIIIAAFEYGVLGAGSAWLCTHLVYFILWVPYIHRKFLSTGHVIWLRETILPNIFVVLMFYLVTSNYQIAESRVLSIVTPMFLGIILLFLNLMSVHYGREGLASIFKKIKSAVEIKCQK